MKSTEGFSNKIQGDFPNNFEETSSFLEYSKALSGDNENSNRLLVVDGEEYIIKTTPNDSTSSFVRGFGGSTMLFYLYNGEVLESKDTFCKGRTTKVSNALKIENKYNPYSPEQCKSSLIIYMNTSFDDIELKDEKVDYLEFSNNTLFVKLPWCIKEFIDSNNVELQSIGKYYELLCSIDIDKFTHFQRTLFRIYKKEISKSNKKYVLISHDDNDSNLLKYVYTTKLSEISIEKLEGILLQSSWQYSSFPLRDKVDSIKKLFHNKYSNNDYKNSIMVSVTELKIKMKWYGSQCESIY